MFKCQNVNLENLKWLLNVHTFDESSKIWRIIFNVNLAWRVLWRLPLPSSLIFSSSFEDREALDLAHKLLHFSIVLSFDNKVYISNSKLTPF